MSQAATASSNEREFSFSDKEFQFLAGLANERTGIKLEERKKDMVYSRLVRRLRALKLDSFASYCALLEGPAGEEEMGNLVNAITTNLTSFFREKHHFEHLASQVIAPIAQEHPQGGRLRIWSAGCSAGMEPYSIAMVVRAALKNINAWDAKILATDIDSNMLETGRIGRYAPEQLGNIPRDYHHEITTDAQGYVLMGEQVRSPISFKQLNLLEHWPMQGPFDAIFCRNVVIYFDKPTQQKLFARMAQLLKPSGWLYIGHSENLFNVCDQFELVGRTIYRKLT